MRHVTLSFCFFAGPAMLLACSSTNNTGPGSTPDAGMAMDGGAPCARPRARQVGPSAEPVGTKLASGENLSVRGVTSDGYVVYSDDAAFHLHATKLPGGGASPAPALVSVQDLGALGSKFWVIVDGNVVFAWSNVDASGVGTLSIWTSSSGLKQLSTSSYNLLGAVSADGSHVLYVDGMDSSGTTGNVSIANADGTSASTLVQGAYVKGCFPQLGFLGGDAVASHCTAVPSGSPSATLSSFSLSTHGSVDLASQAANYWSGSTATNEVLFSTGGGVKVVPGGGGATRTIDPSGFIGQLSSDGATAYYSTMTHAFRRSSVSSPSPVTLVRQDFGGLYALSDDDAWALYYWKQGSSGSDLYLASTTSPGTPATLSSTPTAGLAGDAFTRDSTHALYMTATDACNGGSGTLNALAVGTSSPVVLGHGTFGDWAAGAARVVFTDGYVPTGGLRFGRADIEYADTARGGKVMRVVDQADAIVALSPLGDKVVYSWSARSGTKAGVYVTALPR